jgi:hypothetical protein
MKNEEHITDDEFEPIELGSVSAETKGRPLGNYEIDSGSFNSRD